MISDRLIQLKNEFNNIIIIPLLRCLELLSHFLILKISYFIRLLFVI